MKIAIEIDNNRITIPEGCSVRQEGNLIYFEPKEEEEDGEVKSWDGFLGGKIEGVYIDNNSNITETYISEATYRDRNTARTEAHCRAMLAMAMISQLKPHYGGDITKEEWDYGEQCKYGIYWNVDQGRFCVGKYRAVISTLITFHTEKQAKRFIENNRSLLLDYFMLNKNKGEE